MVTTERWNRRNSIDPFTMTKTGELPAMVARRQSQSTDPEDSQTQLKHFHKHSPGFITGVKVKAVPKNAIHALSLRFLPSTK